MTIGNKLKKRIIDYIFKPIETKKNSSIEFMRIFSMLCIVLFHFTDHGRVILGHDLNFNLNWLTMAFARLGGVGKLYLYLNYWISISLEEVYLQKGYISLA